jgi:hypothetical protein
VFRRLNDNARLKASLVASLADRLLARPAGLAWQPAAEASGRCYLQCPGAPVAGFKAAVVTQGPPVTLPATLERVVDLLVSFMPQRQALLSY